METQTVPPKPRPILVWLLLGVAVFIAAGVIALWFLPEVLLNQWVNDLKSEDQGEYLGIATNVVLFGLGGVIALIGVALSLARHRQELASAERDRIRLRETQLQREADQKRESSRREEAQIQRDVDSERELRSRYVSAVELLADDTHPIKRIAGIHALGSLADDWDGAQRPDEAQVCINVITDYLRAPLPKDLVCTPADEVAVKTTGYGVIRDHLQEGARHPWGARQLNLSGAHIDFDVDLSDSRFGEAGGLNLTGATLDASARVGLSRVVLHDDAALRFTQAKLQRTARLDISRANLHDRAMVLLNAVVLSDDTHLDFSQAKISDRAHGTLAGAKVTDDATAELFDSKLSDFAELRLSSIIVAHNATVDLSEATVSDRAALTLTNAAITGSALLEGATLFDEGTINLRNARLAGAGTITVRAPEYHENGHVVLPDLTTVTEEVLITAGGVEFPNRRLQPAED